MQPLLFYLWGYYFIVCRRFTGRQHARRKDCIRCRDPRCLGTSRKRWTVWTRFGHSEEREHFLKEFTEVQAESQRMFWSMIVVNRWFSVRIPVVSGIITFAVGLGGVGTDSNAMACSGVLQDSLFFIPHGFRLI